MVVGDVVDTCGTGGDGAQTFNISTVTAFVAAGAGLKVAKHGNRAMSSRSGSADVLEALGVKIDLDAVGVKKCIETVGIGFLFAPVFHPAMGYAAAPRREIGVRTVFNILGPLTNPAGAKAQVIGVSEAGLVDKIAAVLAGLGCRHALVVYGSGGLDEVTNTGKTTVVELKDGRLHRYEIDPAEFGLPLAMLEDLKGGDAAANANILLSVLSGTSGPQRDVVLMNAAAVLLAGDKVSKFADGVVLARRVIDNGSALKKLNQLIEFSRRLGQDKV
jgi:anthranilate phosphoribosyltransferase